MTYVDASHASGNFQPEPGRVHDYLDRLFGCLGGVGQNDCIDLEEGSAASERTPIEQRLADFQKAISEYSMHLPHGFGIGLSKQFANMLGEEAWEKDDELPNLLTLSTFLNMLLLMKAARRPGIGTNGRGSITAFWRIGRDRLTVDCLPSGEISWTLTAVNNEGSRESAAGECQPNRLPAVLAPYDPRTWFDQ